LPGKKKSRPDSRRSLVAVPGLRNTKGRNVWGGGERHSVYFTREHKDGKMLHPGEDKLKRGKKGERWRKDEGVGDIVDIV